jgi:uncharacterized oligopeptide transporter (OPT) family protein
MPNQLEYLRTLSFIVTIAAIVQVTELVIQKTSPVLHQVLGIYLPLITTNCAVLGVPLLNVALRHNSPRIPAVRLRQRRRLSPWRWSCSPASANAWRRRRARIFAARPSP